MFDKTIEEIEDLIEKEMKISSQVFKEYNLTTEKTLNLLEKFSNQIKNKN